MKQLVILAGGKGTRLKERTGDHPKGMIPVCGKPVLEHQIELAQRYKFDHVHLLVGYGADEIIHYFGNGLRWGLNISYQLDTHLAGTTHSLLHSYTQLSPTFFVLYGDEMVDVDLDLIGFFHKYHHADVTMLVHPSEHPEDSDLVEVDSSDNIQRVYRRSWDSAYGNVYDDQIPLSIAPLYVMQKLQLNYWRFAIPVTKSPNIARDLFPLMLANKRRLMAYRSDEYIKDIGTPERYDSVCAEWEHRHDYQSHTA
jgi:NDP-sugar pyrophosphorylase family protein